MIKINVPVNHTVLFTFLLLLSFVLQQPTVHAASSKWEDLGGGKVRLVATLDPNSNKVSGVIEIKLKPGWTTYWRYPGSSGIPPLFNFSGSQFYEAGDVKFPTPTLLEASNIKYAGYKKQVSFPFEGDLLAIRNGTINLDLVIGVCSEICIPAKANLTISAKDLMRSDPRATQSITLANLSLPKQMQKNTIIGVEMGEGNSLNIKVKHSKNYGTPQLFVEGPSNWYLKPAHLIVEHADHAVFSLDISHAPDDAKPLQQKLKYTLVTGSTGVEFER